MISLQKNKFLMHLLTQITLGLSALNKDDPAISQALNQITQFLSNTEADGEQILETVKQVKDIVSSYGVKPGGDKPTDDPVANLPGLLFNTMEELDHAITTEMVMNRTSHERKMFNLWATITKYSGLIK